MAPYLPFLADRKTDSDPIDYEALARANGAISSMPGDARTTDTGVPRLPPGGTPAPPPTPPPTNTTVPPTTGPGAGAMGGDVPTNLYDPIRQRVLQFAKANPGANPSLQRDPDYWVRRIKEVSGGNAPDWGYWATRFMMPEGPPEGSRRTLTNPGPYTSPQLAGGFTDPNFVNARSGQLIPFTSWDIPFVAPNDVTEQNDPGWKFRLQQGQQAIERAASARGTLLTGGTLKDLTQFGQDYASGEYGNVYARALGEYQQAYNIFNQNQGTQFNRLASLAGLGQTSAGQIANTSTAFAGMGTNTIEGIGNARAAGIVGSANAYNNAIGNLANLPWLMRGSQYGRDAALAQSNGTP